MPHKPTPSPPPFTRVWAYWLACLWCCLSSAMANEVRPDLRLGVLSLRSEQDTERTYAPVVERL